MTGRTGSRTTERARHRLRRPAVRIPDDLGSPVGRGRTGSDDLRTTPRRIGRPGLRAPLWGAEPDERPPSPRTGFSGGVDG